MWLAFDAWHCLFVRQLAWLNVMPGREAFLQDVPCACFADCFLRRAFGARGDASFNRLVPGY